MLVELFENLGVHVLQGLMQDLLYGSICIMVEPNHSPLPGDVAHDLIVPEDVIVLGVVDLRKGLHLKLIHKLFVS